MPKVKTVPIKSLSRVSACTTFVAGVPRVYRHDNNEWLEMFFDGGCRGNPGPCGAGAVLYLVKGEDKDHNEHRSELWRSYRFIEHGTNNLAEYNAILDGMEFLVMRKDSLRRFDLRIFGDSGLVVNQLNGRWKVKSENIRQVYEATSALFLDLCTIFHSVTLSHVKRHLNTEADGLANTAMDERGSASRVSAEFNDLVGESVTTAPPDVSLDLFLHTTRRETSP